MFEDDKYKSYIALCRELRLKREFEDGDFFWHPDIQVGDWLNGEKIEAFNWSYHNEYGPFSQDLWRWLPRFDQWLELLEKFNITEIAIHETSDGWLIQELFLGGDGPFGYGATREEAIGSFYMNVASIASQS